MASIVGLNQLFRCVFKIWSYNYVVYVYISNSIRYSLYIFILDAHLHISALIPGMRSSVCSAPACVLTTPTQGLKYCGNRRCSIATSYTPRGTVRKLVCLHQYLHMHNAQC